MFEWVLLVLLPAMTIYIGEEASTMGCLPHCWHRENGQCLWQIIVQRGANA
jgi:hypothetical protein